MRVSRTMVKKRVALKPPIPMMALIVLVMILSLSLFSALASPDEASGVVTSVQTGDTFKVDGFGMVHLADEYSPQLGTIDGVSAKEFTLENLMGVEVFLDIDDGIGRNPGGVTECLVYLSGPGWKPDANRLYNRMMVQAGHATVKKEAGSEFDPAGWQSSA